MLYILLYMGKYMGVFASEEEAWDRKDDIQEIHRHVSRDKKKWWVVSTRNPHDEEKTNRYSQRKEKI